MVTTLAKHLENSKLADLLQKALIDDEAIASRLFTVHHQLLSEAIRRLREADRSAMPCIGCPKHHGGTCRRPCRKYAAWNKTQRRA